MKTLPVAVLAALAALPVLAERPLFHSPPYVEGEVLVRYRQTGVPAKTGQELGLQAIRSFSRLDAELLQLPAYLDVPGALALLRADPGVAYAEPNFLRRPRAVVPNDPLFSQQWGLRNTGQANFIRGGPAGVAGGDLNLAEAWDANGDGIADRVGLPSVIVAVIDDSVDTSHPDLAANVIPGRDVACNDSDPNPANSDDFHGTLVAGCAVGIGNNGVGIAGVAWRASLMPIRFGFNVATHLAAIEFARSNGAHIINASFGGPGYSQAERDAIANLANDGILYVAAGGNDDSNTDLAQLNYPANYDADNIVAVAATNRQDNIASFSQYGTLTMDVAAPGLQIVTTRTGNGYAQDPGVSGTSFASPYVAGVAALLKSHISPAPSPAEMKARLIESGTAVDGANAKQRTSGGRVDAKQALDMAVRPSLVIRSVQFSGGDGNGVPDPGENLNVEFEVRNLWATASTVVATLQAEAPVTVLSAPVELGTLARDGTATASFNISVAPGIADHRYVRFTLDLGAGGSYAATRSYLVEIGTLVDGAPILQSFNGDPYDEFHAWHFDVPAAAGGDRTLILRTHTDGGEDVDLLAKSGVPPHYSITVGINPETSSGYFCTSGTADFCEDPDTEISGRLDGDEAITLVNPPVGPVHLVVVNFVQQAVPYTLSAELVDGDLRPDNFSLGTRSNVANGSTQVSDPVTISGISAPTFVTVVGGDYGINGGAFTTQEGTVANGDQIRARTTAAAVNRRVQLTVGGVTSTFLVNPSFGSGGGGSISCPKPTVGVTPSGSRAGGALDGSLLLALVMPALFRRRKRP